MDKNILPNNSPTTLPNPDQFNFLKKVLITSVNGLIILDI